MCVILNLKLFNMFLSEEQIPCDALKGMIITLPKSGKTRPVRRENHRCITLLPVIYKLFEKIILERIRTMCFFKNVSICHPLQSAYHSKLCSLIWLMTSFNLQETIAHFTERGLKV